jgi:hypothetical protein
MEELRQYLDRSRTQIDQKRGWRYEAKVLFPGLDVAGLKALTYRAGAKEPTGNAG